MQRVLIHPQPSRESMSEDRGIGDRGHQRSEPVRGRGSGTCVLFPFSSPVSLTGQRDRWRGPGAMVRGLYPLAQATQMQSRNRQRRARPKPGPTSTYTPAWVWESNPPVHQNLWLGLLWLVGASAQQNQAGADLGGNAAMATDAHDGAVGQGFSGGRDRAPQDAATGRVGGFSERFAAGLQEFVSSVNTYRPRGRGRSLTQSMTASTESISSTGRMGPKTSSGCR
jgi:hypothetical protein